MVGEIRNASDVVSVDEVRTAGGTEEEGVGIEVEGVASLPWGQLLDS